jgi:hypothetical protein
MTGLSVVRMISHVGVRLMVRHGSGGHSTDGLQDKSRSLRLGRPVEGSATDQRLGNDVPSPAQPAYSQNPLKFSARRSPHGEQS